MESGGRSYAREAKRLRRLPPTTTYMDLIPKEVIDLICEFVDISVDGWVVLLTLKSDADVQKEGAEELIEIAKGCVKSIGENGAIALAGALRYVPSLSKIDLRYNYIGEKGAIEIARALKHVPSLSYLNLGNNSIRSKGAIELAKALKHVPSLSELYLDNNSIGY